MSNQKPPMSIIGLSGDEAKNILEQENPGLNVEVIPHGWMYTTDYRKDRVRVFLDEQGKVTKTQRG